ncbi:MAG: hypothetical protein JSR69_16995 [Proteobacteria bacterium]|nr:hypothetical protein [Pseudomonadota bacterium]
MRESYTRHTLLRRQPLASALLAVMIVLAALTGTGHGPPSGWAGASAWLAAALLWPRLPAAQKRQAVLLAGCGLLAFGVSLFNGQRPAWLSVLTQNTALLGMLGAVSFLQLLNTAEDARETLPQGRKALWRTALGVHLLGAVINLSAVFIMAERIRATGKFRPEQAMILGRAFLAAALWSPFFAATAVALTNAPGANPMRLAGIGAALAAVLLVLAVRDIERALGNSSATFVGYPMHLRALRVPALLSVLVAAGHWLLPHWAALSIVSLSALAIVCAVTSVERGPRAAARSIYRHARDRLPGMSGELILFLAAGVFASGLQSLISLGGVWMPFSAFGTFEAAIILALMILLSILGIHVVISITIMASWLAPLHPEPDLLALVFVESWAIGLAAGSMSGIHIAIQGRFGVPAGTLARGNMRYCLQAYCLAVVWLALASR